jgi:hypothetical protein
VRET